VNFFVQSILEVLSGIENDEFTFIAVVVCDFKMGNNNTFSRT